MIAPQSEQLGASACGLKLTTLVRGVALI